MSSGIGHGLPVKALAEPAARTRESVHPASNVYFIHVTADYYLVKLGRSESALYAPLN